MSRRDIQYFDLYEMHDPLEDFNHIKENENFPFSKEDAQIKELYGDLGAKDFNRIFRNNAEFIHRAFGRSI
jgi:hypothetical protein